MGGRKALRIVRLVAAIRVVLVALGLLARVLILRFMICLRCCSE
jgi:hypothetical protein